LLIWVGLDWVRILEKNMDWIGLGPKLIGLDWVGLRKLDLCPTLRKPHTAGWPIPVRTAHMYVLITVYNCGTQYSTEDFW